MSVERAVVGLYDHAAASTLASFPGASVRRRRNPDPRSWAARHLGIVGPRAWAVVPIPARLGWTRRLDIDRRLFYDDWRRIVVRRRIVPIRVRRAPPPRSDTNEAVAAVDMVSAAVTAAAPPAPAPPFTWRHHQQKHECRQEGNRADPSQQHEARNLCGGRYARRTTPST